MTAPTPQPRIFYSPALADLIEVLAGKVDPTDDSDITGNRTVSVTFDELVIAEAESGRALDVE